ncbi:hypothetical protein ON010_g10771 [Phytophthora cinnamomi]|nr:hypothetical protein ON010_g10771 [Phytophthora cinnamomi]
MEQNTLLYKAGEGEELAEHVPYRQAIVALLYLSRVSRPDISFVVNQAASQCSKPSARHWHALKRITTLRVDHAIHKMRIEPTIQAIDSRFPRQTVVAKSSTAAGYIAADTSLEDLKWTAMLIYSLTGVKLTKIPMKIDDLSTIQRRKKKKTSNSQKSVDIAFHSIKDAYQDGTIKLAYCPNSEMLVDDFTNALGKTLFCHLRCAIGLAKLASSLDSRGSVDATDESGTNPSQS